MLCWALFKCSNYLSFPSIYVLALSINSSLWRISSSFAFMYSLAFSNNYYFYSRAFSDFSFCSQMFSKDFILIFRVLIWFLYDYYLWASSSIFRHDALNFYLKCPIYSSLALAPVDFSWLNFLNSSSISLITDSLS